MSSEQQCVHRSKTLKHFEDVFATDGNNIIEVFIISFLQRVDANQEATEPRVSSGKVEVMISRVLLLPQMITKCSVYHRNNPVLAFYSMSFRPFLNKSITTGYLWNMIHLPFWTTRIQPRILMRFVFMMSAVISAYNTMFDSSLLPCVS